MLVHKIKGEFKYIKPPLLQAGSTIELIQAQVFIKMPVRFSQLLKVITFFASISWRMVETLNSQLDSSNEGPTVFHLWMNDSQCSNFTTRFAKNLTFPPTALVAFPGSGNTWLR